MLHSILEVNTEFFKIFAGPELKTPVTISMYRGNPVQVPVIYAKESSDDWSEVTDERYPIISIQDYQPEFHDDWHNDPNATRTLRGAYNYLEGNDTDKFDTGAIINDPFLLNFRYEVHTATKKKAELFGLKDWFLTTFNKKGTFIFNKRTYDGDQEIGDFVSYTMTPNDIPRSDGVNEVMYEFVIKAFVQFKEIEELTLVNTINTNLNQGS